MRYMKHVETREIRLVSDDDDATFNELKAERLDDSTHAWAQTGPQDPDAAAGAGAVGPVMVTNGDVVKALGLDSEGTLTTTDVADDPPAFVLVPSSELPLILDTVLARIPPAMTVVGSGGDAAPYEGGASGTARYRLHAGLVRLEGRITGVGWFTLPANMRPANTRYWSVVAENAAGEFLAAQAVVFGLDHANPGRVSLNFEGVAHSSDVDVTDLDVAFLYLDNFAFTVQTGEPL